jgi:hypothetical protein
MPTLPAATDAQLDELFETSLSTTQLRLEREGFCDPHAHYLDADGRVIGLDVRAEDAPDAVPSRDSLVMVLQQMAESGDVIASTIGQDMEMQYEDAEGNAGATLDVILTQLRAADLAQDFVTVFKGRRAGLFRKRYKITLYDTTPTEVENDIF